MEHFVDRQEAGKKLAQKLKAYAHDPNVIVLALPRGGVPLAYIIAKTLSVPMDLFNVRKLGAPGDKELAIGAMAADGTVIFNEEIIYFLNISKTAIEQVVQAEKEELKRREAVYRGNNPYPALAGKTIILVDDGMATGATMWVAICALRHRNPKKIVLALPVAEPSAFKVIKAEVDEAICLLEPAQFESVGKWYTYFPQITDEEVFECTRKLNPHDP